MELTRNNQALANALIKIHQHHTAGLEDIKQAYQSTPNEHMRNTAYIYSPTMCGIGQKMEASTMFATHPSLEDRLKALGVSQNGDTVQ